MTLETPRTALLNMAPVPVNMAVCAKQHAPTAEKCGFPPESKLLLAFLVRPKPSKSMHMPARKYGQQRKTRKNHPGGPEKGSKIYIIFFEKVYNFLVLDA